MLWIYLTGLDRHMKDIVHLSYRSYQRRQYRCCGDLRYKITRLGGGEGRGRGRRTCFKIESLSKWSVQFLQSSTLSSHNLTVSFIGYFSLSLSFFQSSPPPPSSSTSSASGMKHQSFQNKWWLWNDALEPSSSNYSVEHPGGKYQQIETSARMISCDLVKITETVWLIPTWRIAGTIDYKSDRNQQLTMIKYLTHWWWNELPTHNFRKW